MRKHAMAAIAVCIDMPCQSSLEWLYYYPETSWTTEKIWNECPNFLWLMWFLERTGHYNIRNKVDDLIERAKTYTCLKYSCVSSISQASKILLPREMNDEFRQIYPYNPEDKGIISYNEALSKLEWVQ